MELGNSIKPKHVISPPVFTIYATDMMPTPTQKSNATYVLALTDPDATSRSNPVKAQMCHWIATNITIPMSAPISMPLDDNLQPSLHAQAAGGSGIQELVPYFPPTPPPKTGYHRYVFVVLTKQADEDGTQPTKPKDRPHWGYEKIGSGVKEWAKDNNLTVVGKPIVDVADQVVVLLTAVSARRLLQQLLT